MCRSVLNKVPALTSQLSRRQAELAHFKHCRSPTQSFYPDSVQRELGQTEYRKISISKATCPLRAMAGQFRLLVNF